MTAQLSVSQLISNLAADATTIGLDMSGGVYDRLHQFIESRNILPSHTKGRLTVIATILLASRLVQQQLGPLGPVKNLLREITDDGLREEAKRILESAQHHTKTNPRSATKSIWAMDESSRANILRTFRLLSEEDQRRMREQILHSTAEELVEFSGMPPEDARTVLAILRPNKPPQASLLDQVAENLFPWLREK